MKTWQIVCKVVSINGRGCAFWVCTGDAVALYLSYCNLFNNNDGVM